jgi:hypothetical protein
MKLLMGWAILAGLAVAPVAFAQVSAPPHSGGPPYTAISDFDGPYAAMPEPVLVPRYGPSLLPTREVYTVLRENGFSPLGPPLLRGLIYTIAVIDRDGEDGRLVIDARTGAASCRHTVWAIVSTTAQPMDRSAPRPVRSEAVHDRRPRSPTLLAEGIWCPYPRRHRRKLGRPIRPRRTRPRNRRSALRRWMISRANGKPSCKPPLHRLRRPNAPGRKYFRPRKCRRCKGWIDLRAFAPTRPEKNAPDFRGVSHS